MIKSVKVMSTEVTNNTFVDKFQDKKILVMGSGPSVNELNWENLDYDGIVTCNNFFRNDRVLSQADKILHISFQRIVDLNNETLISFLDNNPKCTIGFDSYTLWDANPEFNKKYKNRICGYDTVRCSNNHDGVGGRLSYFTIAWKPSDLYFIGLDGFSENMKNDPPNAFRDWIKGSADSHYDHSQIKTSHSEFADYVYNFSKEHNINIYNLGEGLQYNVLTEFSEKLFPLPKNIKNKLKESK